MKKNTEENVIAFLSVMGIIFIAWLVFQFVVWYHDNYSDSVKLCEMRNEIRYLDRNLNNFIGQEQPKDFKFTLPPAEYCKWGD